MVALHNRRLTGKDIWPDLLWTDADWHRKRDEFEAQLRAKGFVVPHLFFEISRMMAEYQRRFPSYGDRQRVMSAIYPPKKGTGLFTEEEKEFIRFKLLGSNDPHAEEILRKLA